MNGAPHTVAWYLHKMPGMGPVLSGKHQTISFLATKFFLQILGWFKHELQKISILRGTRFQASKNIFFNGRRREWKGSVNWSKRGIYWTSHLLKTLKETCMGAACSRRLVHVVLGLETDVGGVGLPCEIDPGQVNSHDIWFWRGLERSIIC